MSVNFLRKNGIFSYICGELMRSAMLKRFAVTNYRGFKNRIEWDLAHPSNYEFNKEAVVDGIIKNGIIYGPNGAGKSNLSLALFDIEYHLSQKFKSIDYYENYVYAGAMGSPVLFEYSLLLDGDVVDYFYSKNSRGQLIDEKLIVNGKSVFCKEGHSFEISDEFPIEETRKEGIRENVNHLSIVNFLLTSYPLAKNHYLIKLQHWCNNILWFRSLKQNEFIGLNTGPAVMEEYIIENNLVQDFSNFINTVSGQTFSFVPPKKGDKQLMYRINNVAVRFGDKFISTGTQSLLLLYYWYKILAGSEARFVFIDEFDAFYHFELAYEVCKRLFELKCQVFLSSHNTYLMSNELLRPDCNFILNHNKIKPLCDCTEKEIRWGNNVEKLYRGGAFSI